MYQLQLFEQLQFHNIWHSHSTTAEDSILLDVTLPMGE
jgi:hypothetical protein